MLGTSPADQCLQNQRSARQCLRHPRCSRCCGLDLENPEHLYIQADPLTDWQKLSGKLTKPPNKKRRIPPILLGLLLGRSWIQDQYTVGQLAGRGPIVLPQPEKPNGKYPAKRKGPKNMRFSSCRVLFWHLFTGLRRISDFWTRTPEESVIGLAAAKRRSNT